MEVQAPANPWVTAANAVLDALILGLGEDAAIAAGVAELPLLAAPVINWIFKWAVGRLGSWLDLNAKKYADIVIVRMENSARRQEYDKAIDELKKPNMDKEAHEKALQAARDAADRIINRNK